MAEDNTKSESWIDLDLDAEEYTMLKSMAGAADPAVLIVELIEKEWARRAEQLLEPIRRAARSDESLLSAFRKNGVI